MQKELRFSTEIRAEETGPDKAPRIVGYAATFDSETDIGGFDEVIRAGAFDDVLGDDVRALFNHDDSFVLGRTAAGTCRIGQDETGLWFEIDPPETAAARDLMKQIDRGDINQCSFMFSMLPDGERWSRRDGKQDLREIVKVARLYDVSVVTFPAYSETTAAIRSAAEVHKQGLETLDRHEPTEAAPEADDRHEPITTPARHLELDELS